VSARESLIASRHRIQVTSGIAATSVRERIERRLGVATEAKPEGHVWAVYFDAPAGIDLDFLRPDVLPPRGWKSASPWYSAEELRRV
jgi:hypothetical protein